MFVFGCGKIYGCKLEVNMFHLQREDFIDDQEGIITVGEMYELATGDAV